jgi:hypothetical protein
VNGVTDKDREPLIEGLPTLMFVDVGGQVSFQMIFMQKYSIIIGTKINEE